jgi:hypothetical protein
MPGTATPPASRRIWTLLLVLGATLCMLVYFGPTDNDAWDPSFYYAQLRSPIVDRDLDLRGETNTRNFTINPTVTGLQGSAYPLGPGLLWSPFFLGAHLLTRIFLPAQANGYSFLYISLTTLGSGLFGVLALLLIYRLCRFFAPAGLACLATLMCLFASPLFFYIFRQPVMSHTTNLFASAGMLLAYLYLDEDARLERWSGLIFGVWLGLCFLTRWSGIILAILPLLHFGSRLVRARRSGERQAVKSTLLQAAVMAGSFLVMITPQLIFWHRVYASWLIFPSPTNDYVASLLPPNFFQIFTHTNRGLPYWFPFALLGMIGYFFIPDRKLKLAAFIYTFLLTFLLGYRRDWYGGGIFGARYYIEALPFISIGFISLTRRLYRTHAGKLILIGLLVLLSAHQLLLMQSVEHAAEPGWVNLVRYLRGKPLGVRWQLNAALHLLQDPGSLLSPRPYVAQERQSVMVNLLAGVRSLQDYLIPGVALLLTPFITWGVILLWRRATRRWLPLLSLCLLGLMVCWSVYLLLFTV